MTPQLYHMQQFYTEPFLTEENQKFEHCFNLSTAILPVDCKSFKMDQKGVHVFFGTLPR